MPLVRFGETGRLFDFTAASVVLETYTDNFRSVVPRTVRLPGMSGGFDSYGLMRAPVEIGSVSQSLALVSDTRAGMTALRAQLAAMAAWGKLPLFVQPADTTAAVRWCWARVNDIQMAKEEHRHSDLHQRVQVVWQVDDPRWIRTLGGAAVWGSAWGGAWGSAPTTINASGLVTDTVVTYNGTVPYEVKVIVQTSGAQTAENVTLERIVAGVAVEGWTFTQVMGNSETLVVDARQYKVSYQHANAFDGRFSYTTVPYLSLEPGSNTIRVRFANSGDAATVSLYYHEAYNTPG